MRRRRRGCGGGERVPPHLPPAPALPRGEKTLSPASREAARARRCSRRPATLHHEAPPGRARGGGRGTGARRARRFARGQKQPQAERARVFWPVGAHPAVRTSPRGAPKALPTRPTRPKGPAEVAGRTPRARQALGASQRARGRAERRGTGGESLSLSLLLTKRHGEHERHLRAAHGVWCVVCARAFTGGGPKE